MYRFALFELLKNNSLKIKWLCGGMFKAKTEPEAMKKLRQIWKDQPEVCKELRCTKDGKIFFHFNNSRECFNIERETYKRGDLWTR